MNERAVMTRSYRHLTFEERFQVKTPKKSGHSMGSIAQHPTGNGGLITWGTDGLRRQTFGADIEKFLTAVLDQGRRILAVQFL